MRCYVSCLASLLVLTVGLAEAHAQKGIIANSLEEFSGTQRSNDWLYGFFDRTADLAEGGNGVYDDTKFTRFRGGESQSSCNNGTNNDWFFGVWTYKPCEIFPQTEIGREKMLPNTARDIEHFPVLRWTADESGTADLTGFFRNEAGRGDGTMGRIFRNGVEIFAEKTLTEVAEFNITINDLMEGDLFDFAVDFGVDWGGNDSYDYTLYSIIVDHTGDFVAVPGDFNQNGVLDAPDIDDLTGKVAGGTNPAAYDLNNDAKVNDADIKVWIKDLFNSWVGDANLDLEFSSSDLVSVLGAGTYETGKASVWSTGDFTGDALTTSSDLVAALSDGGYELGPRAAVSAVPEPTSWLLLLLGGLPLFRARRAGR